MADGELRAMTEEERRPLRKVRLVSLLAFLFLCLFAAAAMTGMGVKKGNAAFGCFALLLAAGPLWGAYSMTRVLRDGRVRLTRMRVRDIIGGTRPALRFDDPAYGQMGISINIYRSVYRSIKAGGEVEIARSNATGRVVSVNGIPLGLLN